MRVRDCAWWRMHTCAAEWSREGQLPGIDACSRVGSLSRQAQESLLILSQKGVGEVGPLDLRIQHPKYIPAR